MDINKRLNDIILKYELDRYYPKFRKKLAGEEVLRKWANEMVTNQVLCVASDQEDIRYFSQLFYNYGKEFSYCLYSGTSGKMEGNFDSIVVISKKQKYEMTNWCKQYGKPIIFIYDYLEMQGVVCEDELYKIIEMDYSDSLEDCFPAKRMWREVILMEFCVQKERFVLTGDIEYQQHYVRKLFFLSLYIRNFMQAEKYQKKLVELGDELSKEAWREIEILLAEMREHLYNREQKDIILMWMDAVSYGTGNDMPYLQKQIANGIHFENAYTVTPHTNPTAQTIFLGKKLLDDKLYELKKLTEKDSLVFGDLKEHGYAYKIISGYFSIFEQKLCSENYHELYAPCSVIFWDVLYHLLNSEKPMFLLAHALMEGHAPHMTTKTEREDFSNWSYRLHKGHVELDEQMNYYMDFLGDNAIKIFMSDHGQPNIKEKFHTYFVIVGKKYPPKAIKELFSYVDFSKLIHVILENDKLEEPLFEREYIEVQMLDRYNKKIIGNIIKNKKILSLSDFGYFGVITKEHLYLKYHIGNEFLTRWDNVNYEPNLLYHANDICDVSSLPYFRKIVGNKAINIDENEKFQYTRYLYKLYENFLKKRGEIIDLINQLFHRYSKASVALRMGGAHSAELFHILADEERKKIAYIIDRNPDCRCRNFGIPIISLNEIKNKNIEAVVLSSFDYLDELRNEVSLYPKGIDIIDIYKILEKHGIYCNNNFYAVNYMTDEDYDVGFPFSEI